MTYVERLLAIIGAISTFASIIGGFLPPGKWRNLCLAIGMRLRPHDPTQNQNPRVKPPLLPLILMAFFLNGCSYLTPAKSALPFSDRCGSLSDRHATWAAVGLASASLAGGSGLGTIPITDRDGRIAIGITTLALAALAVGAQSIASSAAEHFATECSK